MKRIFTSVAALLCLLVYSAPSSAQSCGSPYTFTDGADMATFQGGEEDFESPGGTFTYSSGNKEWRSTSISAGNPKVIVSKTYFVPNSMTTLGWGFTLAGNGTVSGYSVYGLYFDGTSTQEVFICSGGALSSGTYTFSGSVPAEISGTYMRFKLEFIAEGQPAHFISFDNFRTSAMHTQIILPVHFTSLNARRTTHGVQLTWNVELEENVASYQVEKSHDGRSFGVVGSVAATKSSTYNYTDTRLSSGTVYYRIRSVDLDGKISYSTVISLNGDNSAVVIKAFPSPVVNDLTLQHETAEAGARILVTGIDGRMVRTLVPATGSQQTTINMATVAPGTYIIRYDNGHGRIDSIKIIRQ